MTEETIRTIKTDKISHNPRLTPRYLIVDIGAILYCLCMNSPIDYDKQINPIRAQLLYGNKI